MSENRHDSGFALDDVEDLTDDDGDEEDALTRVFQVLPRPVRPRLSIRIFHVTADVEKGDNQ